MTETVGWGLIGASNIARQRVAGAILRSRGGRLVGIASHRVDLAENLAREFGIPRAYDSVSELLRNPAIQAVYVSSHNQQHHSQVLCAAAAGKHVLCEKPLATRLEDAIEMVAACRRRNLIIATNHHLRNAVTVRAMRELVAEGAIGTPLSAIASQPVFVEANQWRRDDPVAGSGVSLDVMVHAADAVRFILGREPVEVTALAHSSARMTGRVNDSIMAVFRFDDQTIAQLYADFNVPQARTRIEVHGTEGSIVGSDVLGKVPEHRGQVTLRRDGVETQIATESDASRYQLGIDRFHAAIRGEAPPACSGADGIRSLAMVLAAEEAARAGHTVQVSRAGLDDE